MVAGDEARNERKSGFENRTRRRMGHERRPVPRLIPNDARAASRTLDSLLFFPGAAARLTGYPRLPASGPEPPRVHGSLPPMAAIQFNRARQRLHPGRLLPRPVSVPAPGQIGCACDCKRPAEFHDSDQ